MDHFKVMDHHEQTVNFTAIVEATWGKVNIVFSILFRNL